MPTFYLFFSVEFRQQSCVSAVRGPFRYPNCASGVRGPFRYAQEDLLKTKLQDMVFSRVFRGYKILSDFKEIKESP
jgi:hypothetical protein